MQYIDTGISPTNTTGIKATFSELSIDGNDFNFLGCRTDSSRFMVNCTNRKFGYGWGDYITTDIDLDTLGKYTVNLNFSNNRAFMIDGDLVANLSIISLSNMPNIGIFAQITNYGPNYCSYKIYNVQISQENTITRNFIPCYRKSDNKPGLYDTINDVFYTNANASASQDFTIGSNIDPFIKQKVAVKLLCSEVPKEYQQVEYLESAGTQYIDTGVSAPNGFRGIMNVSITTQVASYQFFAGAEAISDPWKRNFFGVNSSLQYHLGTYSNTISSMSATINNFYLLDVSTISGNRYYKSDGIDTMTVTDNTTPLTDRNLYIFAINSHGSVMYYSKIKIKQFLLYNENNTIVRNFIPCYRKADNKPGLYDTINGVFYTNANTNTTQDFTVGSNKWIIK